MATPRDPMLQALSSIGTADQWRKEFVGSPTYFAAAMLSWHYSESSVIGSFLILVCFIMLYHYVYEFVFPQFESRRRLLRLSIFFVAQVAFWGIAFFVWFNVLKDIGR